MRLQSRKAKPADYNFKKKKLFNWQIKIVYIYGVQHDVLLYVYIVESLNQAN